MAEKQKQLEWTGRKIITSDNVTKGIEKKYNEKTGKYETVAIDIPKITVAQQIEKTKAEINQSYEIAKKLSQQHETLREQVQNLRTLVTEKAKQFKKEQEERDRNLMKMIKSNNLEIAIAQVSEEKIAERLVELEKELKSAQKSGEILANERDKAKQQNESKDITKEIESLQSKLEEENSKLKNLQKTNQILQRASANNQKRLERAENGMTEAAEINQLNKELCMLRDKENKIKEKKNKLEKDIEIINKNIDEYSNKIDEQENDKVQKQVNQKKKVLEDWEKKQQQLENEQQESNLKLVRDKKKQDKDQEKEHPKEDDVQKSVKQKRVVDYIREKKDYSKLKADEQNFIQLFTIKQDLEKQLKKKKKKVEKERDQMESLINSLKLERNNLLNSIKEKEREREMAEAKEIEEREKLEQVKEKKKEEMEKKEKEKLEKQKSDQRQQLSPLKAKTAKETITKETLRKEKDEQLKQFKEKYQKMPKEKDKRTIEPFKLSFQELEEKRRRKQLKEDEKEDKEKVEVKSLSIIEAACRTKHRGTTRVWFGSEPTEQTTQFDDVHVLGQFSIKHRIRKIIVHHNPEEGLIYLLSTEYKREDDTLISGVWNINQEFLKGNNQIQKEEFDISNDRIKQILIRQDNNFIISIQFTTKSGKQYTVGKTIIEKQDEEKSKEKQDEQKEKKEGDSGEKKEDDPNKKLIKLDDLSMVITFFGGYTMRNEKEQALSYFGCEIGKKLNPEEYEQYLQEKKQRMEKKLRENKLKQLEESLTSDLNKSTIRKK